ncbi:uncharacterized protein FOMMEDRAFT_164634 [Fomitiporia mediterranea MF3/22]|uniref:uncharacterized protein n=1 Tax=Fomitiporia mediterranea (strain MF3/22) TaxID=694068 RepID=UPI0004409289|nr:uncharacterized protein FOMMEDRAFT_164634 [Fomitiporia mediterranea MF3/22]EJD07755.1 hypothetical protein FOMMEDRAFT_164634 [Fomitiporia mediterranea MF3/22]
MKKTQRSLNSSLAHKEGFYSPSLRGLFGASRRRPGYDLSQPQRRSFSVISRINLENPSASDERRFNDGYAGVTVKEEPSGEQARVSVRRVGRTFETFKRPKRRSDRFRHIDFGFLAVVYRDK